MILKNKNDQNHQKIHTNVPLDPLRTYQKSLKLLLATYLCWLTSKFWKIWILKFPPLILTKFSRFYRSTMTSQVFCQKFPNENLAERLARSAHNLKVLGSIPGWEFFKSFFLLKFSFFQNNFMFCAILNKKYHCKCFLSLKNGNWCQKRTFQNVKISKILKSASTNLLQVATSNSFAMSSGGPKEHLCEFFWSCDDFYFQESKITPLILMRISFMVYVPSIYGVKLRFSSWPGTLLSHLLRFWKSIQGILFFCMHDI